MVWTASEQELGDALRARGKQLGSGHVTALGLPDLCHFVMGSSGIMRSQGERGAFFYVFGIEVSSAEAIAAYVATLSTAHQGIKRVTYCSFDAFRRRDVRVEIALNPSTVNSYVCDVAGNRQASVTEQAWSQVHVSAVLRALDALDRDRGGLFKSLSNTPMVMFDPLTSPAAENAFLRSCDKVFWQARQLGCFGQGKATNCINILTSFLLKHFIWTRRSHVGEKFFSKYKHHDPEIALVLAHLASGFTGNDITRILGLLATTILRHGKPVSQKLLVMQSRLLRKMGHLEAATALGREAVNLGADYHLQAVINLANCFVEAQDGMSTLAVLNSIDIVQAAGKFPRFAETLDEASAFGRWPCIPTTFREASSETSSPTRKKEVKSQPVNKSKSRLALSEAASRPGPICDVYSCLASLTNVIGWKEVLKSREELFFGDPCERNNEQTEGGVMRKRACTPWLESLLKILQLDLVKLARWKDGGYWRTSESDWLNAGILSLRLQRFDYATKCFGNISSTTSGTGIFAMMLLVKLHCDNNKLDSAIHVMHTLVDNVTGLTSPQLVTFNNRIKQLMMCVISKYGALTTKEALRKLPESATLVRNFQDVILWNSDGYNK
eukprot:m.57318 g.57318  ORF g.57318 m.57318 type:complete len:611 (+) comp11097_c0_seq4:175-2007(+)